MTMTSTWDEIAPMLIEVGYRAIQSKPEYLLMHDGGPLALKVDLYHYRLIGLEDEIVRDWWARDMPPDLRVPAPVRPSSLMANGDVVVSPLMPTHDYRLQSNYSILNLALEICPDFPAPVESPFGQARIAFLIYKREPLGNTASQPSPTEGGS